MMEIYWLEQCKADLPDENDWLSSSELIRLNAMRFAKRRAEWRLGRWTAKCAVAVLLNSSLDRRSLAGIEILPALSGAPEVSVGAKPASVTLSLSHRDGLAVCAVVRGDTALGCDMEIAESRVDGFIADYFTAEEQQLVLDASIADRWWLLALLWSGKEAALKALHEGLRLATQRVVVSPGHTLTRPVDRKRAATGDVSTLASSSASDSWSPLSVRYNESRTFQGWWQRTGNVIRTVVADPPPARPVLLKLESKNTPDARLGTKVPTARIEEPIASSNPLEFGRAM